MKTPVLAMFAIALILGLASSSPSAARTWLVTPDGTGDAPTVQAAIDSATTGDIVELADGVFTGDGNRDVDLLGKAITVRSQSGDAAACVVDCAASSEDQHRGFVFQSAESAGARLEQLTVSNGYVESDNPLPDGVGGGILVMGGAAPTLDGVVLRENTAMAGGGMAVFDGAPAVTACEFVDNTAWWGSGGALDFISTMSPTTVADCLFRGNSAHQAGGAVATTHCDLVFERCGFYENEVEVYGGGLEAFGEAVCELVDCTFAGNSSAIGSGGAVYVWFGAECTLRRCTLAENVVPGAGSGIGIEDAAVFLANTIIAFGSGAAVACASASEISLSCTDIYGNEGGDWVACIADQAGVAGNRSVDPLFCGDDNPDAPYTLDADSPCAPDNYPCLQIGAWPVGCSPTTAVPEAVAGVRAVLHGASPNPFNPRTTISFSLDRTGPVEVAIHDLAGRRVVTLAAREFTAGEHAMLWDGRDAAGRPVTSGAYCVRLRSAAGTQASKLMLLR